MYGLCDTIAMIPSAMSQTAKEDAVAGGREVRDTNDVAPTGYSFQHTVLL